MEQINSTLTQLVQIFGGVGLVILAIVFVLQGQAIPDWLVAFLTIYYGVDKVLAGNNQRTKRLNGQNKGQ